jgi:hypothetical protein
MKYTFLFAILSLVSTTTFAQSMSPELMKAENILRSSFVSQGAGTIRMLSLPGTSATGVSCRIEMIASNDGVFLLSLHVDEPGSAIDLDFNLDQSSEPKILHESLSQVILSQKDAHTRVTYTDDNESLQAYSIKDLIQIDSAGGKVKSVTLKNDDVQAQCNLT